MVIMNDLEWPMLSYYMIENEKFKKVMQQSEKVALNIYESLWHSIIIVMQNAFVTCSGRKQVFMQMWTPILAEA